MQYRRYEDFATQSPTAGTVRDRRIELGHDPYLKRHSPRARRSLSPRRLEGPRRVLGGDRRSSSLERSDYGWDLGGGDRRSSSLERRDYGWDLGGGRGEKVRSRSPPFGQVHKRPHYDEGFLSRDERRPRYKEGVSSRDDLQPPYDEAVLSRDDLWRRNDTFEYVDMNADLRTGLKHEYAYEHGSSSILREKILDGGRSSGVAEHHRSMVLEDALGRGMYRLPSDFGSTSKYTEAGGNFSLSAITLDRFKDERIRYPNSLPGSYGKGEKNMSQPRDVSISTMPASPSKDPTTTSHFKDFAYTSSGFSRANFPGSYRNDMPLLTDEFPNHSVRLSESLAFSGYGERHTLDTGRDPEAAHKELACFRRDKFNPARPERRDYLYPRPGLRESNEYGLLSDDLYGKMGLHAQVDHGCRDILRPSMLDPVTERIYNTEYSQRNPSSSCLSNRPSMQRHTKQGDYLDSGRAHDEFGKKVSGEQEIPHLDVSWDHEISHERLYSGFGKDAGPVTYKERTRSSPEFQYETEMHRFEVKTQGIKAEELGAYDPSDRVFKRKYGEDEKISRHNYTRNMSSQWNNFSRALDPDDREEWINLGYNNDDYRRGERTIDGDHRHRMFASDDPLKHVQGPSIKPYKPGGKYIKGHPKRGSVSWNNSYRFDRRHVLPKPHNVWVRGKDDNQVDVHANEVMESEDWVSSAKSEPPEDSEEFKQLVDKFFLSFTKKLNENPVARKRYKEHGRAGCLFCIVCGSLSKEFMDTQALVKHAFMSHKVGLRAQHLGLHKAICVLMGWNSVVAPDIVTWSPEVLSSAEALAQKEDLIIWPPIVLVHNCSISENNSEKQTIEALEDFLRGKGFRGGKVKVCSGKSAIRGIMLVSFLGTFSGLQDAEKLHKYFTEKKHGRTDFEQKASSKGKSSGGGIQQDKLEELLLYGYMGIAEDLDKVDSDTRRKSVIKSKKEIKDFANAPVKSKRKEGVGATKTP